MSQINRSSDQLPGVFASTLLYRSKKDAQHFIGGKKAADIRASVGHSYWINEDGQLREITMDQRGRWRYMLGQNSVVNTSNPFVHPDSRVGMLA